MTQDAQKKIEQRVEKFRQTLKPGQWEKVPLLIEYADKIGKDDPALALRILQHARNINPDSAEVKSRLGELTRQLKLASEDLMTSSSKEDTGPSPKIRKTKTAFDRLDDYLNSNPWLKKLKQPLIAVVVLPFLFFAFYQIIWASNRYESQTQLIVQQPDAMATLDPSMALISGFTGGASGKDTELVKAFILSNDLVAYLEKELQVSEHYSSSNIDVFSRLASDSTVEQRLAFHLEHVEVFIDDTSGVLSVKAQAFTPEFAKVLTEAIVARAEWYINKIGHDLAKSQLTFVQKEHDLVTEKLQLAKTDLLAFQRQHNLLDPEAEGLALQQIAYELEGQIASKKAELRALRASMSESAPQVLLVKEQLDSIELQLDSERQRLTNVSTDGLNSADGNVLGVNEILARYSAYKLNMEFATQAYSASQVSLEKSRIEAYRQLKFLIVVEAPTLPEEAKYPRVIYNLVLFLVIMLMIYGIGKIIYATAEELR